MTDRALNGFLNGPSYDFRSQLTTKIKNFEKFKFFTDLLEQVLYKDKKFRKV